MQEGRTGSRKGHKRSRDTALLLGLVDPNVLFSESIRHLLQRGSSGISVIPEVHPDALIRRFRQQRHQPHIVILHIGSARLSEQWVRDYLKIIANGMPGVPVGVLSDSGDKEQMLQAIAGGATCYFTTMVKPQVLFAVLRLAATGCVVGLVEPGDTPGIFRPKQGSDWHKEPLLLYKFTTREHQVLELLKEGYPNKLIAADLGLHESTVKVHVRNIMKKLGATNRTEAALMFSRIGASAVA